MALSKLKIQTNLRPFLLAKVSKDVLDLLTDENFVDIFNDVAKDLNSIAELRVERYRKVANSTNAEDDDLTNYLLQRPILKVFSFKLNSSDWEDQIWTWLNDSNNNGRIVLKNLPGEGVQLDLWYLGDLEDVTIDGDEIDLPDNVMPEYMELLKRKILSDYGDLDIGAYEESLLFYSEKARAKNENRLLDNEHGAQVFWFHQEGDTTIYEISDQWVSSGDNVYSDVDGNYHFYT